MSTEEKKNDFTRRVECVRINDLHRFGPILSLRKSRPGSYFRCIEGLPEDAVLVGESIDPMAQDIILFFQHESFPECPIGQAPLEVPVVMEVTTLPLMSTSMFRELTHLVRLLQPLEQEGRLPAGLATLNRARKALEEAREATFETASQYLYDYETLTLEIVRDDEMPAFGAFLRPNEPGHTDPLYFRLNVLGHFVAAGEGGEEIRFSPEEVRRNLVGTLMHEFGHALEYLLGLPTSEAQIEAACAAWAGVEVKVEGEVQ